MSNPFTKVVQEYEALWPNIEKLISALEETNLSGEVVIPSKKCGDAYVTYDTAPKCLSIEHGNKRYTFQETDL